MIEIKFGSFKFIPKSSLGIDIGTSTIKVVELSRWGTRKSLKNYGEMRSEVLYDKPFRTAEKSSLLLSSREIARAIRGILEEAKIEQADFAFAVTGNDEINILSSILAKKYGCHSSAVLLAGDKYNSLISSLDIGLSIFPFVVGVITGESNF